MRTRLGLPRALAPLDGLPPLPRATLSLHSAAQPAPAAARLRDILLEVVADGVPAA